MKFQSNDTDRLEYPWVLSSDLDRALNEPSCFKKVFAKTSRSALMILHAKVVNEPPFSWHGFD